MKIDLRGDPIVIEKEDTPYDAFVREFLDCLPPGHPYVLISGYVALAFGRSRMTEDIDLFVARMGRDAFQAWWEGLSSRFQCLSTKLWSTAYDDYLEDGLALRWSRHGELEPNMEVKWPKGDLDAYSLRHAVAVRLNGYGLRLSPLELQVAYKAYLGSEKDLEDARHLVGVLGERLKRDEVQQFLARLRVDPAVAKEAGL